MTGSRDVDLIRRIEALERSHVDLAGEIRDLNAVKNMGRGVLWFILKVGTICMTLIGLVWAILTSR